MRAIVIDDSRTMRTILRRLLAELGFEVLEAARGDEALALLDGSGPVDLALVDWNMPGMSGLDFVQRFRTSPSSEGTKIMMVTTETDLAQMSLAVAAGAHEYLMKPFEGQALVEKLELLGIPTT